MKTISIIIPAYNCEKTIRKCIDSIIKQSVSNWELIVVNDGSSDNTRSICEEYVDNNRIFLINKDNGGVSSARNVGIDNAKGDYIIFVDSDDYLLDNALSVINDTMNDHDICYYNYQISHKYNIEYVNYINKIIIFDINDFSNMFNELFNQKYIISVFAKCYKRSNIKVKFDESLNSGEDLLFNLNYLKECKSLSLVPYSIYNYQQFFTNSLSSNNNDKSDQFYKVYDHSIRICNELFKDEHKYKCITNKYVLDQLNEIEKKIRYKHNYGFDDMIGDISKMNIDKLCINNDIHVNNRKWDKAVSLVSNKSYHSLFIYLKLYKLLGLVKHKIMVR